MALFSYQVFSDRWRLYTVGDTLYTEPHFQMIAPDIATTYTWQVPAAQSPGTRALMIDASGVISYGDIAGDGLAFAAGVLSVGGTADRITVNADSIDIASTYAGQTSITTLGTVTTGAWSATPVTPQYGGTGANTLTANALIVGNGTNTVTTLSPGAAGQVVRSTGTAWASAALTAADVSDFSEATDDRVAGLLTAGTAIGLSYDDPANTLTINNTGVTSLALSSLGWLSTSGSTGAVTLSPTAGQPANQFLGSPDGSTGAVSLRSLVAADIPTLTTAKISDFNSAVTAFRLDQFASATAPVTFGQAVTFNNGIRLTETGGGTDYFGFIAPSTIATSFQWTLPNTQSPGNRVLQIDSSGLISYGAITDGTVTSVGLDASALAWLTVAGSPITSSGNITLTATTGQTANRFLATPNGSSGAVGLRAIVAADLPDLSSIYQPLDSDLTAIAALTTTAFGRSLLTQADAAAARTTLGAGTVSSVGLSLPSFITVSGSPVTGSGTLTGTLASQTANTAFMAPNGTNGAPTFRAIVAADIPTLTAAKISDFDTQVRSSRLDQMAQSTGAVTFGTGGIRLIETGGGSDYVGLLAPNAIATSFNWTLPNAQSPGSRVLQIDSTGQISYGTIASGTVTSVALTTPSWLTVTGSPITSSGTLAITATTGLTANQVLATPDGTTGALSPRSLVPNDLPVVTPAKGGTGLTSLTANNLLVGAGTGSVTFIAPGASGNVIKSNGTTLSSAALVVSDLPTITPAKGGTGLTSLTANNLLVGAGTGNVTFIAPGANLNVLASNGTVFSSTPLTLSYISDYYANTPDKGTARVATTAALTLTSATATTITNSSGLPTTIDGVTLASGDRILVKNQTGTGATGAAANGWYLYTAGNTWTRWTGADTSAKMLTGSNCYVSEGTANGSKYFTLTTAAPITLGTTQLTFTQVGVGTNSWGAWQTLTLENGWTANTSNFPNRRTNAYRVRGTEVEVSLCVTNSSATLFVAIATLPVGVRPVDSIDLAGMSSDNSGITTAGLIVVRADGTIVASQLAVTGATAHLTVRGIIQTT